MTPAHVMRDTCHLANIAVLIPAWQPDQRLTSLVSHLLELGFGAIVIVNDGSDSRYDEVFQRLALRPHVHVLRHDVNLGKGRALKTGLTYFKRCFPEFAGIVTADADGQHRPEDIRHTAEELDAELRNGPSRMVLGSRRFKNGVPLRSRLGNVFTRLIFAILTGKKLSDTQSGLRGIPAGLVPSLVDLEGERYEYEMDVLMHAVNSCGIREVPIETIYLDGNRSSHFRPLQDSMRIYFVLLRFVLSSLIAAGIDFVVFAAIFALTSSLITSVIAGRVSSLANFALNRRFVFKSGAGLTRAVTRYYLLVLAVGVAAYGSIHLLTGTLGMNVLAAKILAETTLWFASFAIQRTFVFGLRKPGRF